MTRVAAMEVRTAVYRAYVAGGASSGEAEAAAELATNVELIDGSGVRLAVAGLDRFPRVGAAVVDGDPARLADPEDRAPLLRLRIALDWCAATGRPIVVPGLTWSPALAAGDAHPDGALITGPCRAAATVPLDGIEVDADAWRALDAAAERYLVPER